MEEVATAIGETAEALGVGDALEAVTEAITGPAVDALAVEAPVEQTEAPAEVAVEQPAVEAPVEQPKRKKIAKGTRKVKGKVKTQPKTLEEWIEARVRDPKTFRLTSEGNALAPAIGSGNRELILDIPKKSPATAEQIEQYYAEREASIKDAKTNYAEARRALYNVHKQYKAGVATISDYLLANKQVNEAEQMLIASGVKERSTKIAQPTPLLRDLYPEAKNTDKKTPIDIYELRRVSLPWSVLLVDAPPEVLLEDEAVAEAPAQQAPPPEPTDEERERARVGAIIATRRRIKK